jgi:predicted ATPase
MLTRLYIDNFRCFEKFEWRPGRKQLIIGRNGTGKTSLMDALRYLRLTAARGDRLETWFKLDQRTLWLDQREQVFEIEARIEGGNYAYRLVIEPQGRPRRPVVRSESLSLNDQPVLVVEGGQLIAVGSESRKGYALEQSRAALPTVAEESNRRELRRFREWLGRVVCSHINPFSMEARAEKEALRPRVDFANMAGWYRHLVQARRREDLAFLQDLRKSLDGFDQLFLEDAGESVRVLYAEFLRDGRTAKIPFGKLSDGQRCLICLYAIMHFVVSKGDMVIIDEPDNFISLREIQPWLMAIEEMADDHKGQVILISHHPEILNQWAPAYGVQFVRDGAGPVWVEKFKGDPESPLSAAELVARGWDLE